MANGKKSITPENLEEWVHSTGLLLPRNDLELARFEKLFGAVDERLTGKEIDPDKILKGEFDIDLKKMTPIIRLEDSGTYEYRMVARNGANIPDHILAKMKKNHQRPPANDNGAAEKGNK